MRVDRREVEQRDIRVVRGRGADIDTDLPAGEARGRDARILERLPGDFQQVPLLGVHLLHLAAGHAEGGGIEGKRIPQIAAGEGVGGAGRLGVAAEEALRPPAIRRGDVLHGRATRFEECPESLKILRARQAQAEA
jgi:hypothetical protein